MKLAGILISISLAVCIGCISQKEKVNQFTSLSDTLILKTEKVKGYGMFPAGAGPLEFKDTTEHKEFSIIFPKTISDIKLRLVFIDYKPFMLDYKRRSPDKIAAFLKENVSRIDTSNIPSIKDNSLSIMSGLRGKETVIIIDENNNKDFTDDSIRTIQPMDFKTITNLIKCNYKIYDGEKLINDSTWINIGTLYGNLFFFVSNHLLASFSIDKQEYQLGIIDKQSHFGFDEPIMALLSEKGLKKDSLPKSDLIYKGEYVKLNDSYYRFDNISNDGKRITLIKEKDISNKTGTQVGMIAPYFIRKAMSGDTLTLNRYKGQYLLLANLTACTPETYKQYSELTKLYQGKLNYIGLDNSIETLPKSIAELKLPGEFIIAEEEKDDLQHYYRPDYSSRTCFLINPEGRIIDKFDIENWKIALKKIF